MAVQARHPYGLALSSYLEAFDRAQQLQQLQQLGQVKQASMLHDLTEAQRKRQEEEQVMRDLTAEISARRSQPTLQPNPQIVPAVPPVEGGPDVGPGLPGSPPRSLASTIPQTTPQVPFGASLPPERQAAVLASPKARPVIQGIEEQEKQTERIRLREEARQLFDVAQERFKASDMAGGFEELAKAYTRMGMHNEAGQQIERALKIRGDTEEQGKAGRDMDTFLKAEAAYREDPTVKTYAGLLEAMSKPESVTFRAFRTNLVQNQLKASMGRDPYSAMLFKKIADQYRAGWEAGKQPTFDEVAKQVEMEHPGLLFRVLSDELEKGKPLQEEFAKRLLRMGEDIDPAKLKDEMAQAMELFRRKTGRGPRTADELSTVITQANTLRQARKEAELSPEAREIRELNLEMKRRAANNTLSSKDSSLMVQRWTEEAAKADTVEDKEIADANKRFWMDKASALARKEGAVIPHRPRDVARDLLKQRSWTQLADEEKTAVLFDVAKRKMPAKVKTFEDLKRLSAKEKQLLNNEITRLEEAAAGERGAAGARTPGD